MGSAWGELSQKVQWRPWYGFLAWYARRQGADFRCMNWGYDDGRVLVPEDVAERYPLQLYHAVAEGMPIEGRVLADVSCGRGGGLAYLHRRFRPAQSIGVDFTRGNVDACRRAFDGVAGLSFRHGDALRPPLEDASTDILVSVEASHCYGDRVGFLDAARRVLRPGGHLLWTDFIPRRELAAIDRALAARFEIVDSRDVTGFVLAAMRADGERRRALVARHSARVLHPLLLKFAAAEESADTVQRFRRGESVYFLRRLRRRDESRG